MTRPQSPWPAVEMAFRAITSLPPFFAGTFPRANGKSANKSRPFKYSPCRMAWQPRQYDRLCQFWPAEKLIDRFQAKGHFRYPSSGRKALVRGSLPTGDAISACAPRRDHRNAFGREEAANSPLVPDFAETVANSLPASAPAALDSGEAFLPFRDVHRGVRCLARWSSAILWRQSPACSSSSENFGTETGGSAHKPSRLEPRMRKLPHSSNLGLTAPLAFVRRYATDAASRLVFSGENIYAAMCSGSACAWTRNRTRCAHGASIGHRPLNQ